MNTLFTRAGALFNFKIILPVVIIILASAGAYATVATAPKARKRPQAVIHPTVDTQRISMGDHQVWVPVMGTVTAAREISLESRVSGEVQTVSPNFVPGGFFAQGEEILRINPEDYELALSEVKADVTTAEYDLKLEQGYQKVSAREWNLLKGSSNGTEADSELALRKPHLEKAKADLKAAMATLEQARLNLKRTRITAPFASTVETKSTDVGAAVSEQETLATLVGTDEFWVEASVPVDRLDWISIPVNDKAEGSVARIISGSGTRKTVREGRVVRLLPSLESEGRMARVIISVKDPLNLEGRVDVKPLLLDSYVTVQIDGGTLNNVYTIPRSAYHENGSVWILGSDGTLDIRTVNSVWRENEVIVLADGLADGETLVTSTVSAPVQGMKLRSASTASASEGAQGVAGVVGEVTNGGAQ
ncbi:efflux RND transporter periplasmic adaptor subunit [Pseudodesulfovibrio sediminis]|uniref:Membrane protein n=1 Tax=Pseudodesulfovibrio sediminis TaxID=2810563 RepID=A0ABN6ER99_9BACT|nr:efflux RND transporter periplasmic adaptor subunit [Pseudodesulfovibrio sediminis]BCS87962.1 membrane protein [Pseudodesulfovibrio sediminis]